MQLNKLTLHELVDVLGDDPNKIEQLIEDLYTQITRKEDQVKAYLELADKETLLEKAEGNTEKPLRGVPGAIKDNIQTIGFNTTCGSAFLENYESIYDATAIEQLKDNGSPVLGKTNMDEFAMGSSTENSYFQTTHNPHDLQRVPGGSSGGSAAAVAADEAIYALGSDTGGSVRHPAALCGVVGLKPTYGLVSRHGLTAFASSLDQIGPITKDVYDAALLLEVIGGNDPNDSTSFGENNKNYTAQLDQGISGLTVGFPREYFGEQLDPRILKMSNTWKDLFRQSEANIAEISLPHTEYAIPTYYLIACSEASANLARFDGVRYTKRAEGESVAEMFSNSRDEGFGPEVKRRIILGTYALSAGYYEQYYQKAQQVRALIKEDFDSAFESVDVIAAPTSPTPAFEIGERTDDPLQMYLSDIFSVTANLAGTPAVSIPAGSIEGLPVGLQIMGEGLSEAKILKTAYHIEQRMEERES